MISSNFSLYTDFPKALQIYNHHWKHWSAAYWQEYGIRVIHAQHEMVHTITYPKCTTVEECVILDRRLRDKYVSGISQYNSISWDDSKTNAEAFVKMRKRLKVSDEARKLVEEYVEVQRKW